MPLPSQAEQIQGIATELARSQGLPPYEAIDAAWLALLKAANTMPGQDEHERTATLLRRLPQDRLRPVLFCAGVETLLALDPPLESLLTAQHEEIDGPRTARQLDIVRTKREAEPYAALGKLVSVLRRVRNRRMHGFKTPDGPRDQEILTAATETLQRLGAVVLEVLTL